MTSKLEQQRCDFRGNKIATNTPETKNQEYKSGDPQRSFRTTKSKHNHKKEKKNHNCLRMS